MRGNYEKYKDEWKSVEVIAIKLRRGDKIVEKNWIVN